MKRQQRRETPSTVQNNHQAGLVQQLIRVFGLTANEARIYETMLRGESFTAREISEAVGVHRTRVYDNLRRLENKKLIAQMDSEPLRFSVLLPMESLVYRTQVLAEEHEQRIAEAESLGRLLTSLRASNTRTLKESGARIVQLDDVVSAIRDILRWTKERVWVCKRTAGGVVDWFALGNELERLVALGVDIRFLSDRPIRTHFQSRSSQDIEFSFAIIDEKLVTFSASESGQALDTMMIVSDRGYVRFLANTFTQWWTIANEMAQE
ncbi:MAG: TrmB family transcriptional regulator [Candidatus Thorarchaeota archaeon]|jgi:sugar-specific transcriptional regulator TrmB